MRARLFGTPPILRYDFPPAASTNDIAGQILDSKEPLKTSYFQGLFLVAGTGNPPRATFVDGCHLTGNRRGSIGKRLPACDEKGYANQ
jgi:hypothetical protein